MDRRICALKCSIEVCNSVGFYHNTNNNNNDEFLAELVSSDMDCIDSVNFNFNNRLGDALGKLRNDEYSHNNRSGMDDKSVTTVESVSSAGLAEEMVAISHQDMSLPGFPLGDEVAWLFHQPPW